MKPKKVDQKQKGKSSFSQDSKVAINFFLYIFGMVLVWTVAASVLRFHVANGAILKRLASHSNNETLLSRIAQKKLRNNSIGFQYHSEVNHSEKKMTKLINDRASIGKHDTSRKIENIPLSLKSIRSNLSSENDNFTTDFIDDEVNSESFPIDQYYPMSFKETNRQSLFFDLIPFDNSKVTKEKARMLIFKQNPAKLSGEKLFLTSHRKRSGEQEKLTENITHYEETVFPEVRCNLNGKTNCSEFSEKENFRSSDPTVDTNTNSMDVSGYEDIPTGELDTMDSDIPGEPLTPRDFYNAKKLQAYESINMEEHDDPITTAREFEGDIRIENGHQPNGDIDLINVRAGIINNDKLWRNGVVPYLISSLYGKRDRSVVALALSNFHIMSCVRFIPRTTERDFIHFLPGDGCSSNVGRITGSQAVSLGPGCLTVGVVMHELMHTLGFWHEQSRADRDSHVRINWENIQNGKTLHFQKYKIRDLEHFGRNYDLRSLMHYSMFVFAKNRSLPTVEAIEGNHTVGQRNGLSKTDAKRLRELYSCPNSTWTSASNSQKPKPPVEPSVCEDSDHHCPIWALAGECESNAAWMKSNCQYSCKQCNKCQDLNSQCLEWAGYGQCEHNTAYMHLYCKHSCGICGTTNRPCIDLDIKCQTWAAKGECGRDRFRGYMDLFCKQSCGLC